LPIRASAPLLITGEGSHQLTANDIDAMGRFGATAIVFVLNNDGYFIERSWEENPIGPTTISRPWKYAELPKALGCADWFYRARGHARRTRRSHEGSPREQIRH
jgi:TPP-dependent 2-oxoacid decarboxylase